MMDTKRYCAIDGLRTIAMVGIVMMHMIANNSYLISGFVYNTIIPSFTNFVFLFMTISGFGMACGYYEKFLKNEISVSEFYERRLKRIAPFFSLLVLVDVLRSRSLDALCEGFIDLTFLFGLLPNPGSISVIGVGWFLGLTFVFYLCFPFFCFLFETRKRAWMAFAGSIALNVVCDNYFGVGRTNILYSGCFFLAGMLIYLYREKIESLKRWPILILISLVVLTNYLINQNMATWMIGSILLLMYAMLTHGGILANRFTKFFSNISMEIYLSHMMIFRVLEKMKLNYILGDGWVQYITTVIAVMLGTTVFAYCAKNVFRICGIALKRWSNNHEGTFGQ